MRGLCRGGSSGGLARISMAESAMWPAQPKQKSLKIKRILAGEVHHEYIKQYAVTVE